MVIRSMAAFRDEVLDVGTIAGFPARCQQRCGTGAIASA
jgi:hypothetical protein